MSLDYFYITGLWFPVYGAVYVPLALIITWLVHRLILRRLPLPWLRFGLAFPMLIMILAAPVWDVYFIGQEAKKLCQEQAGLRVYRTVEAEGFRSTGNTEFWAKHGFSYLEHYGIGPDKYRNKYRYVLRNGKEESEGIPEFTTRYEVQGKDYRVIGKHFGRNSVGVVDTQNGDVLGELVTLSIYPGWFDSLLLGLTGTGSGFSPWLCGDEPLAGQKEPSTYREVVLATIKPVKSIKYGSEK